MAYESKFKKEDIDAMEDHEEICIKLEVAQNGK